MDTRITKFSLTAFLAALIFTIGSAQADDTDVYMNPGAGLPANSEPMVTVFVRQVAASDATDGAWHTALLDTMLG